MLGAMANAIGTAREESHLSIAVLTHGKTNTAPLATFTMWL